MKLAIYAALIALGIVAHFVKKLYDLEQAGTILHPRVYVQQHPYGVASAVLGAYLLAAVLYYVGQINEATAILLGATCSSAFDSLRAHAAGRLRVP